MTITTVTTRGKFDAMRLTLLNHACDLVSFLMLVYLIIFDLKYKIHAYI